MIPANSYHTSTVQRAYDRRSWIYSKTVAKVERDYHVAALRLAAIKRGEQVLEVAVGPGLTAVDIAAQVGHETTLAGVDLSQKMLSMTQARLESNGFYNHDLRQADARALPFEDQRFDLVYCAYLLDLIPQQDMQNILREFKRVLKPGGRMVMLNMSKAKADGHDRRESLYRILPPAFVLYVMGGCRPVLMEQEASNAGFTRLRRTFMPGVMPSEIVIGYKEGI